MPMPAVSTRFRVTFRAGTTRYYSTLIAAVAALKGQWPALVTESDDERTLCWADSASAENDSGANAVAEIRALPNAC
jgi:hypothetical protein